MPAKRSRQNANLVLCEPLGEDRRHAMKFSKEGSNEALSVLGAGAELVGELNFTHDLRVDGTFKGKVRSDDATFAIGPKGRVEAEVSVKRASISGELRGTVRALERVEIRKEGRVYGDLYTPCLIIEAGAIFEGKCNMTDRKGMVKVDEGAMLKIVEANPETSKAAIIRDREH